MQVKDTTLKGAIRKALAKQDPHAEVRKRCRLAFSQYKSIEAQYSRLMTQLENVDREIDRIDTERNPVLGRLARRIGELLARGRQLRGAFQVLRRALGGDFGPRLWREIRRMFDFAQEARDLSGDLKSLWSNLSEWETLQSKLVDVSNAGAPFYRAIQELESEINRLGCQKLPAESTDLPVS